MKHFETLLIPVLMLSDYLLTVAGAVLKDERYAQHFQSPHYELNPIFQKAIGAKRWFSPRHLLFTVLYTGLVGGLAEFGQLPSYLLEGIYGCLFVLYGAIIGQHLSNILMFRYLNRHPDEITGRITMAHSMSLAISLYRYLGVSIPVGILAAFSRSPYAIGGFVGTLLLFRIHFAWIWRHKKQRQQVAAKDAANAADSK